jgi:hypothetical protein
MKNGRTSQGSHGRSLVTLAITRAVEQEGGYRVDQKPQNTSSVPEEITSVPKELASEASREEEGALKRGHRWRGSATVRGKDDEGVILLVLLRKARALPPRRIFEV